MHVKIEVQVLYCTDKYRTEAQVQVLKYEQKLLCKVSNHRYRVPNLPMLCLGVLEVLSIIKNSILSGHITFEAPFIRS